MSLKILGHALDNLDTKLGQFGHEIRTIWTHYYFFLVPQTPIKWEYEKVIHTPITVFNKGF